MSFLRRKGKKDPPSNDSSAKAEEVRLAPVSKIMQDGKHTKKGKRGTWLIFALGGLFGIVVAGFFAERSDLVSFPEFGDLSMDSLMDVLPAGVMKDARDISVRIYGCGGIVGAKLIEI